MRRGSLSLCLVLVCAAGCDGGDGAATGRSHEAATVSNGVSLNGVSLNGVSLNGVSLNGTELTAVTAGGQPLAGDDLVGASLVGQLSNGDALTLRVRSAEALAPPNDDVWAYQVDVEPGDGTSQPLCGTAADGAPILAVPVAGVWDYRQGVPGGGSWSADPDRFTLGCRFTAIAKCVELGYKPWLSAGGAPLAPYHVACTRMIRADYCGDGTPYTFNGQHINVYDDLGIQDDAESWPVDAEWTPDGARCVERSRQFTGARPTCFADLAAHRCGQLRPGTLLVDEYQSAQTSTSTASGAAKTQVLAQ